MIRIPYGEHFTTPTLLAALALEDTEENRARVIKAVDDCPIPIFIPTHRVGDPETEHDEEYHYPAGEDVKGAFMALGASAGLRIELGGRGGRQAARLRPAPRRAAGGADAEHRGLRPNQSPAETRKEAPTADASFLRAILLG